LVEDEAFVVCQRRFLKRKDERCDTAALKPVSDNARTLEIPPV